MPAVVPFLPAIISAVPAVVGGVTSYVQGKKAADQNQQYINQQDKQYSQVAQFAQQLSDTVQRAEYEAQANRDVNKSLQDVFGVMAQRGMGRSTAGLTASADASAKIRSTYTQQYMSDRLSAIQQAGTMLSGVAASSRQGFTQNPFAGVQNAMNGLGNAAGLAVSPFTNWVNERQRLRTPVQIAAPEATFTYNLP